MIHLFCLLSFAHHLAAGIPSLASMFGLSAS
jgi:hypothetical protein